MASPGRVGMQPDPPPVAQLLQSIRFISSTGTSAAFTLWGYGSTALGLALKLSFAPVRLFVLPLLSFIFAPLLVSLSLLFSSFLALYYAIVYVAQTIYPVYVVLGTAIICGVVVGVLARQTITLLGNRLFRETKKDQRTGSRTLVGRPSSSRSVSKGKKKASVKFESAAE